jgi:Rps23 Pro-64 3,4-dihydroxylase Tpa1-like proline 4-hydroxylase
MTPTASFSLPAVHQVVYADEFCPFAHEIREELLRYPAWVEMTQDTRYGAASQARTDRQNGITTRHIDERHRTRLPHTLAFRDMLGHQAAALAARVGVDATGDVEIEMNAMAYGEGAWLSPHTDYRSDDPKPRRVAWMLYLTHPQDGEWLATMGGAVRLFEPDNASMRRHASGPSETHVRPRFNRFAMFQVSDSSLHEIEPVTWNCAWDRCRMAISGWLRAPDDSAPRATRMYLRTPDANNLRAERAARLKGAIAMYSLLRSQRAHVGSTVTDLEELLARYEFEHQAQVTAPPGTVFSHIVRGPAWCIVVVDEANRVVYLGARDGYRAD